MLAAINTKHLFLNGGVCGNIFFKLHILKKFVGSLTNVNIASMALHISIDNADAESCAVDLLKSGKIIAVPTDTVYGLACSATNKDAINRLYLIKARNENKPVAICVGKVSDVKRWAIVSHLPKGLLSALLPGPVTLVLNCANKLDQSLSLCGKVGIRIPDYPFIRNVANGLDCPIALTSANISSEPSSVKIQEFRPLWDKISGIFDGGILGVDDSNRGASTVVDLCDHGFYKIIRNGIAGNETTYILEKFGLKLL